MEIYSRWGEKVYSGNSSGWDGRFEGAPVPVGVYTIYLKYYTKDGEYFETKNTLQLIR